MKNKKTLLILILVFVLLLGGAYVLYDRLGETASPDQLAVQPPRTESPEPTQSTAPQTEAPEPTQSTAPQTEAPEPSPSADSQSPSAPDFTVYDAEGNEVRLYGYIGKPIVLNFWASWCGPCQMEMPDFQEKYLELGEDVQFLMINMTGGRETLDSAREFIQEKGYTFPVLYDLDGEAAMMYGAYSLPTTYFIDAEGHAIARAVGAIDAATLQQGIDMIWAGRVSD